MTRKETRWRQLRSKINVGDGREVHAGRKRINPSNLRGKNDARQQLIINSRYSNKVLKSQQTCSISENRNKLEKLIAASNGKASYNKEYQNRLLGLLSVWDNLVADNIGVNGKEYTTCYLRFEDALEMFYSCFESIDFPYLNTDKDKFVYALLNEQWGLCVYVITLEEINDKWLVLRPDEISMELFLDAICNAQQKQLTARIGLDRYVVESIFETLDTEWDRVVARVLLGLNRSMKDLNSLGIDGNEISRNVDKVINYI